MVENLGDPCVNKARIIISMYLVPGRTRSLVENISKNAGHREDLAMEELPKQVHREPVSRPRATQGERERSTAQMRVVVLWMITKLDLMGKSGEKKKKKVKRFSGLMRPKVNLSALALRRDRSSPRVPSLL